MIPNPKLLFRSVSELGGLLRAREVTSTEIVEAHLAQIYVRNPKLRALVYLDAAGARETARRADQMLRAGQDLGPMHGIPVTVKDAFRVRGMPSTYGLPQYRRYIPTEDSLVVERLRGAGAVILGRTNVPIASFDWQCRGSLLPEGKNPWDLGRTPGGSSGGAAAAIATGMSMLEVGSDIGGSIRYPAHCCGVYGLRTTDGLISVAHDGPEGMPAVFENLVTNGPIARSLDDLQIGLRVLADLREPPRSNAVPERLRISVSSGLLGLQGGADIERALIMLSADLRAKGHEVREELGVSWVDMDEACTLWGLIVGYEYQRTLPAWMKTKVGRVLFDELFLHWRLGRGPLLNLFKAGLEASETQYREALGRMHELRFTVDRFFTQHDLWILPVSPGPAIRRGRGNRKIEHRSVSVEYTEYLAKFLCPTTVLGTPVLTLPIGRSVEGLPMGIQIHGARFADEQLLQIAQTHLAPYTRFERPPGY